MVDVALYAVNDSFVQIGEFQFLVSCLQLLGCQILRFAQDDNDLFGQLSN